MTHLPSLIILVLCILARITFSVISLFFFRPRTAQHTRLKAMLGLFLLCYASEALLIWQARVSMADAWIAGAIYAGAVVIFALAVREFPFRPSSIFCEDAPPRLVTGGPYQLIRHPIYTSYLLAYVASALASRDLHMVALLLLNLCIFASAALEEEKLIAASPLARSYADYQQRTGFLLPSLRKWHKSSA